MTEFKPIESQEQFDEMVKDRVDRAKRSAAKDYEARIAELEQAANDAQGLKTTIEELQAKINETETAKAEREKEMAELTDQVAKERMAAVKVRAAVAAGLPVEFADRLTGDDEEAVMADAEAIKKMVGGKSHVAPEFKIESAPEDRLQAGFREMAHMLTKKEV